MANADWSEGHSGWNLFANTARGIYNLELEFCTKNRPGHTNTHKKQPTKQPAKQQQQNRKREKEKERKSLKINK